MLKIWDLEKISSSHGMKRHGRGHLQCMITEGGQSEKAKHYMISTLWHFEKVKTMEKIKDQWLWGVGAGGGGEIRRGRTQRIFKTMEIIHVVLNDGYMLLSFCSIECRVNQEWTLR